MAETTDLTETLRALALQAEIEVDDERLTALLAAVLALLRRPPAASPVGLGETEPAFGLQLRRGRS